MKIKNLGVVAALLLSLTSLTSFAQTLGPTPPAKANRISIGNAYTMQAWGDSLTAGNEDGTGVTYPGVLNSIDGRAVTNNGVGGQTSTQILMRQGGVAANVNVSGNQLVAGANAISSFNGVTVVGMASNSAAPQPLSTAADNSTRTALGTLCTYHGTLTRTASGGPPSTSETYTFTPDAITGTQACAAGSKFTPDTTALYNNPVILWVGRNNYSNPTQVKADIAAAISAIKHQNYLILSVLNGDYPSEYSGQSGYNTIVQLNSDLAAAYPGHYLNARAYLVSLYNPAIPQDVIDHGRDVPPSSLRVDNIHLNAAGYTALANYIENNASPLDTQTTFITAGTAANASHVNGYNIAPSSVTTTGSIVSQGGISLRQDNGFLRLQMSNGTGSAGFQVSGNGNYVQTLGNGILPSVDNVPAIGLNPTSLRYSAIYLGTGTSYTQGPLVIGGTVGPTSFLTLENSQFIDIQGGGVRFNKNDGTGTATLQPSGNGAYVQTTGSGIVPASDNTGTLGILTQRYNSVNIGTGGSTFATTVTNDLLNLGGNLLFPGNGNGLHYNAYFNSGWKYAGTGYGGSLSLANDGTLYYANTFASGSAGGAATIVNVFQIDKSGHVGILKTPVDALDLHGGFTLDGTLTTSGGLIQATNAGSFTIAPTAGQNAVLKTASGGFFQMFDNTTGSTLYLSGDRIWQNGLGNVASFRNWNAGGYSAVTWRDASALHSNTGAETLAMGYYNPTDASGFSQSNFIETSNDPETVGTQAPKPLRILRSGYINGSWQIGLVRSDLQSAGNWVFKDDTGATTLTLPAANSNGISFGTFPKLPVTVAASLPTCNSGLEGAEYGVSDANSTTFHAAVAGGGSNHVKAYCSGAGGWVVGG